MQQAPWAPRLQRQSGCVSHGPTHRPSPVGLHAPGAARPMLVLLIDLQDPDLSDTC